MPLIMLDEHEIRKFRGWKAMEDVAKLDLFTDFDDIEPEIAFKLRVDCSAQRHEHLEKFAELEAEATALGHSDFYGEIVQDVELLFSD